MPTSAGGCIKPLDWDACKEEREQEQNLETHEEISCQRENKHISNWSMNSLQMKSFV